MTPQYGFWGSVVPLYAQRHRRTLELIHIALRLAKYAEMNFKHALCVRRAHEYSPQIQPMIQTPNHGSMPSGHSTEAFIVARVLLELVSTLKAPLSAEVMQLRQLLLAQAARIAINRTVAGLHYPIDSMAGQMLGMALAEYFIQRCTGPAIPVAAGNVDAWAFDGESYPPSQNFSGAELFNSATGASVAQPFVTALPQVNVPQSSRLAWLWTEALQEWAGAFA
jgi:hypothetical protein